MSSSDPKKAAPKKAVAKKAETEAVVTAAAPSPAFEPPKAPPQDAPAEEKPATAAPKPRQKAERPDGAELARLRRLARAGLRAGHCALLGIPLDTGPRANPWAVPAELGGEVVSALAVAIVEAGVSPEALELAADRLRERGQS